METIGYYTVTCAVCRNVFWGSVNEPELGVDYETCPHCNRRSFFMGVGWVPEGCLVVINEQQKTR